MEKVSRNSVDPDSYRDCNGKGAKGLAYTVTFYLPIRQWRR